MGSDCIFAYTYTYRTSGHQVKSLTVAFPSFCRLRFPCEFVHTRYTQQSDESHTFITSFAIKVSKSKSDLGHFFNNVGLCVCIHFTIYSRSLSLSLWNACVSVYSTVDLSRKWSNNEKSTRPKWMYFKLAMLHSCTVCVKMPGGHIGSNKSQFSSWIFFPTFFLLVDNGERLNIYNRTQSFDYILCENRERKKKKAPRVHFNEEGRI